MACDYIIIQAGIKVDYQLVISKRAIRQTAALWQRLLKFTILQIHEAQIVSSLFHEVNNSS